MADLDTLAETLDGWAATNTVSLTETDTHLTVNQLDGAQAATLWDLIERVGWGAPEVSDRSGEIPRDMLTPATRGVTVRVEKPPGPQGVELVLTNTAFAAALDRDFLPGRFWVRRLTKPFSTIGVRFAPWDDQDEDPPLDAPPESRKVVRFLKAPLPGRRDLSRWLMRQPDGPFPDRDTAFGIWKSRAAFAAASAMANEIDTDGTLLFRGPPVSRFRLEGAETPKDEPFAELQRAVIWAYENPRELENRHGLLATEVARSALRDGDLGALCEVAKPALEGARIAYGFGVAQQSKDTLKALTDLRKAVMDETSKLSDTMRSLAGAVSSAAFGSIGLIVARLTLTPANKFVPYAAVAIGVVLGAYVASVIASGFHFMALQKTLRQDWRSRLYSFLTPDDYDKLVSVPVKRAEDGYTRAAWASGFMTALLLCATIVIVLTPPPAPAKEDAPAGTSAPAPSTPPPGEQPSMSPQTETPSGTRPPADAHDASKGIQGATKTPQDASSKKPND
jgi:hypothetical protein